MTSSTEDNNDKRNYLFDVEKVLANSTARSEFMKVMVKSHRPEYPKFLSDYEIFLTAKSFDERKKQAEHISDVYINQGGTNQLNLSAATVESTKAEFMKEFSKRLSLSSNGSASTAGSEDGDSNASKSKKKRQLESNVFSKVYTEVMTMLGIEILPDFVRSKKFSEMIKRNTQVLAEIGIRTDVKDLHRLDMEDSEWISPVITDDDVNFFKILAKDSLRWDLFSNDRGETVMGNVSCFILDSKPKFKSERFNHVKPVKFECYLEGSMDLCAMALFDSEKMWDNHVKRCQMLQDVVTPEEAHRRYGTTIEGKRVNVRVLQMHGAGPKNLPELCVYSLTYEEDNIVLMAKPSTCDDMWDDPKHKSVLEALKVSKDRFYGTYCYRLDKITDKVTKWSCIALVSFPSLIQFGLKFMYKNRTNYLKENMEKLLGKLSDKEKMDPNLLKYNPNDPWSACLKYARTNYIGSDIIK